MNLNDLFPENEQPLDRLLEDGGFCTIFRTIACVGDSLSSGEFQIPKEGGGWHFHDMYDYSWGQFMARTLGSKVYNFSKGGMQAKTYIKTFAEERGFWNPDLKCQAYILALGVNDIFNSKGPIGSMADVAEHWQDNGDTFAGYYAAIIQRYKEIAPNAKFFLVSPPSHGDAWSAPGKDIAALLYDIAKHFTNCYVIDLNRYAPVYDKAFYAKFFLNGHMNPMGYAFTAKLMISYIDYIIRHNMNDFMHVGYINAPQEELNKISPV